jgi:hypothetical protein
LYKDKGKPKKGQMENLMQWISNPLLPTLPQFNSIQFNSIWVLLIRRLMGGVRNVVRNLLFVLGLIWELVLEKM